MIWLSLVFNFAGLALLALTMEAHRHAPAILRPKTPRGRVARIAGGCLAQGVALALAIAEAGAAVGVVEWIVAVAVCGFALTLLLAFKKR
jgi:hypothetical protein